MTERHSDGLMLLLHAALDDELDAAGVMDVEGKLAADPALAAEYARLVALRDAIRTRLPRERAPDALRARVYCDGADAAPDQADHAAPLLAASGALSSARGVAGSRGCTGRRRLWVVRTLVDRRRRSACTGLWFHQGSAFRPDRRHRDIRSPHSQTLVRGKIAEATTVVDLKTDGFPLVGGRVDVVGKTPVATLIYQRREHQIALTEMPASSADGFERVPPRNARRLFDLRMDRGRPSLCRRVRSASRRTRRFRRRVPPGSRRRAGRYAKALRAGSILPGPAP